MWAFTAYDISGSWDDDFYAVPAQVFALDASDADPPPLNINPMVLSVGHTTLDPAKELAEAGAPVLLSPAQALCISTSAPTTDAPMRIKGVNSGRMHSTALSLSTQVVLNGQAVAIFLNTGAGPTVADAAALDCLDPGWHSRLKPLSTVSTFTAFGSTLRPLGTVRSSFVFPHPAGCVRITIEFAVIDTQTRPVPFILGMDWMLAYGFNIMLAHGPYFTIGRNKQRYGIATKTGMLRLLADESSPPSDAAEPTIASMSSAPLPRLSPLLSGRPTPQPDEFAEAVRKMKISEELSDAERTSLLSLIHRFPMAFAHGRNQLGNLTDDAGCSIPVDMEHLPPRIRQNAYPASPRARDAMKKCVDEFLRIGIVRPSQSRFAAPALIVFRGEKARLVVNYKVLNSVTTPDAYPMPRIDETLYSLHNSRFFSSLDANKGFHQIPMNPDHAERTAFATPFGQYGYTRMPMGLRNAPAELSPPSGWVQLRIAKTG
ncbi:hypothetical protein JCM5296_000529 [Sporobolomyces johnsonii]